MYCIGQFCRICIKNDGNLLNLNTEDDDNITLYEKLLFCQPYLICEKTSLMLYICKTCCTQLKNSYDFLKMCSKSKIILESYVYQLESVTNNNLSNNFEELMENNYSEVKAILAESKSNKPEEPSCDIIEIDKKPNESLNIQSSSILNFLLMEDLKNKTPLEKSIFNNNDLKYSNLVPTDRRITKQGLEIIALSSTSNYNYTKVPKQEPNISITAEFIPEIVDTDSSQSSDVNDIKCHPDEDLDHSETINVDQYHTSEALIDFLPLSVEIMESDTEIIENDNKVVEINYKNNILPPPKKSKLEETLTTNQLMQNPQLNNTKVPTLKLKLNRHMSQFQIVGKKKPCRICPRGTTRKTVYRCTKCYIPICLMSHCLPFCQSCIHEMPQKSNDTPRDVQRYPFFRISKSLKRLCGDCKPYRNRKSRTQCNDCAKHVCGEHKQYLCEYCALGFSCPVFPEEKKFVPIPKKLANTTTLQVPQLLWAGHNIK